MKINVDRDLCELHGQCVFAAPEVFRFDDDGELQYLPEVDDVLAPAAEAGAAVCPVAAIEVEP
jgi:ferredoxin